MILKINVQKHKKKLCMDMIFMVQLFMFCDSIYLPKCEVLMHSNVT